MKKKLEADLISIAHRILKLKNRSDVEQLYTEARQLYEKLAILRFAEHSFSGPKPTIGIKEVERQLEVFEDSEPLHQGSSAGTDIDLVETPAEAVSETVEAVAAEEQSAERPADAADETTPESSEPAAAETTEEVTEEDEAGDAENTDEGTDADDADAGEPEGDHGSATEAGEGEETEAAEETKAEVSNESETAEGAADTEAAEAEEAAESEKPEAAPQENKEELFIPSFELTFEKKEDLKADEAPERKQITFDDLLGPNYSDPVFEKLEAETPKVEFDGAADGEKDDFKRTVEAEPLSATEFPAGEYKPVAAKNGPARSITFGLSDRIGFEKHLFGGSSEDMNRVVSQLTTFDSFDEARDFIEDMVKPDYNNWEGKEEYSKRFLAIVEQKFS